MAVSATALMRLRAVSVALPTAALVRCLGVSVAVSGAFMPGVRRVMAATSRERYGVEQLATLELGDGFRDGPRLGAHHPDAMLHQVLQTPVVDAAADHGIDRCVGLAGGGWLSGCEFDVGAAFSVEDLVADRMGKMRFKCRLQACGFGCRNAQFHGVSLLTVIG